MRYLLPKKETVSPAPTNNCERGNANRADVRETRASANHLSAIEVASEMVKVKGKSLWEITSLTSSGNVASAVRARKLLSASRNEIQTRPGISTSAAREISKRFSISAETARYSRSTTVAFWPLRFENFNFPSRSTASTANAWVRGCSAERAVPTSAIL